MILSKRHGREELQMVLYSVALKIYRFIESVRLYEMLSVMQVCNES